jgi:hypothetical protein
MIDVTFMLLIFFLLCTRFAVTERGFDSELPTTAGPNVVLPAVPADTLTIYCRWDPDTRGAGYVVAIGSRMRMAVPDSYAMLQDIVPLPKDDAQTVWQKRANYAKVLDALVAALEQYEHGAGSAIESYEIRFASEASRGAASGTAPWAFVTLAIDAATKRNIARKESEDRAALPINFKFADALQRYSG